MDEVDKLLAQNKKLQEMYDGLNEMNKALRHKAGQVFIQQLKLEGGMGKKQSVKGEAEEEDLGDEEAVLRMFKKLEDQMPKGVPEDLRQPLEQYLRQRLNDVGYEGIINAK